MKMIIEKNKRVEIVVPLRPLSNFWRTLDTPLINCEINLFSTWSQNCVLTNITTQVAVPAQGDNPVRTGATFEITDTKLYAPIVTLSTEDDNKLLEQLKTRFKKIY